MIKLLDNSASDVRESAAEALGRMGPEAKAAVPRNLRSYSTALGVKPPRG